MVLVVTLHITGDRDHRDRGKWVIIYFAQISVDTAGADYWLSPLSSWWHIFSIATVMFRTREPSSSLLGVAHG